MIIPQMQFINGNATTATTAYCNGGSMEGMMAVVVVGLMTRF